MSVTQKTPIEYSEDTDAVRCAECGTPASQVGDRDPWCVVCAAPIDPSPDG